MDRDALQSRYDVFRERERERERERVGYHTVFWNYIMSFVLKLELLIREYSPL